MTSKICSAYGCENREDKETDVKFYKFPMHDGRRTQQWILNCQRTDFRPTPFNVVCSQHFADDCFDVNKETDEKTLKNTAIPTIFKPINNKINNNNNNNGSTSGSLRKKQTARKMIREPDQRPNPEDLEMHNYHKTPKRASSIKEETPTSKRKRKPVDKPNSDFVYTPQQKTPQQRKKKKGAKEEFETFEELIATFRKRGFLNKDVGNIYRDKFAGESLEEFQKEMKNIENLSTHLKRKHMKEYALKEWAKDFIITLHYYSPKAYSSMQEALNLPHPLVIRRWTTSFGCEPGFLHEAIDHLGQKATKDEAFKYCVLTFNTVSLRKETTWDAEVKTIRGFINYGGNSSPEGLDVVASEALVFQCVGLATEFRIPVAYFFVHKITPEVLSALISDCVNYLTTKHIKVVATVCESGYTNREAGSLLGCTESESVFENPETSEPIYYLYDAGQLMKLMWYLLAAESIVRVDFGDDKGYQEINWHYIERFQEIMRAKGANLVYKKSTKYQKWQEIVRGIQMSGEGVNTLVADAIDYLNLELGTKDFHGSRATCQFIRFMEDLYHILSSRTLFGKDHLKRALSLSNVDSLKPFLENAIETLETIQDFDGKDICQGSRKHVVLGFVATIKGVMAVIQDFLSRLVCCSVRTYKFSKDNIDLLFEDMKGSRASLNQEQFVSTLRRVMLRKTDENSKSPFRKNQYAIRDGHLGFYDTKLIIKASNSTVNLDDQKQLEHLFKVILVNRSEFIVDALRSVTENIIRKISGCVNCVQCLKLLISQRSLIDDFSKLAGDPKYGILKPTRSAIKMVLAAENEFRKSIVRNVDVKPRVIASTIVQQNILQKLVFPDEQEHYYQHDFLQDDHRTQLIRALVLFYVNLRLTFSKPIVL